MEIGNVSNAQMLSRVFKRFDTDGDGSLNNEEFAKLNVKRSMSADTVSDIFSKTDIDGNGGISQIEMNDSINARLQEKLNSVLTDEMQTELIDALQSGDLESVASIMKTVAEKMNPTYSKPQGALSPMRGNHPPPPPSASDMFADLDTDESNGISIEEFIKMGKNIGNSYDKPAAPLFSQIDTNGDGIITLEELQADIETKETEREQNQTADNNGVTHFAQQLLQLLNNRQATGASESSQSDAANGLFVDKYV